MVVAGKLRDEAGQRGPTFPEENEPEPLLRRFLLDFPEVLSVTGKAASGWATWSKFLSVTGMPGRRQLILEYAFHAVERWPRSGPSP